MSGRPSAAAACAAPTPPRPGPPGPGSWAQPSSASTSASVSWPNDVYHCPTDRNRRGVAKMITWSASALHLFRRRGRGDRGRQHDVGRLRRAQRSQRGPCGRAGRQAVIYHDHAPSGHPRQRTAAPVHLYPPGQLGLLGGNDRGQVGGGKRQPAEQAGVVQGRSQALRDGAHTEFGLARIADLPGHDDVHRHAQDGGDLFRHRHPAPGQGEHHDPFGPIVEGDGAGEPRREQGPGGPPVREGEQVLTLAHVRDLPAYKGCDAKPAPHNGDMICVSCRKRHHEECPGGTWCDCQHLPSAGLTGVPGEFGSEPALSWLRQG